MNTISIRYRYDIHSRNSHDNGSRRLPIGACAVRVHCGDRHPELGFDGSAAATGIRRRQPMEAKKSLPTVTASPVHDDLQDGRRARSALPIHWHCRPERGSRTVVRRRLRTCFSRRPELERIIAASWRVRLAPTTPGWAPAPAGTHRLACSRLPGATFSLMGGALVQMKRPHALALRVDLLIYHGRSRRHTVY